MTTPTFWNFKTFLRKTAFMVKYGPFTKFSNTPFKSFYCRLGLSMATLAVLFVFLPDTSLGLLIGFFGWVAYSIYVLFLIAILFLELSVLRIRKLGAAERKFLDLLLAADVKVRDSKELHIELKKVEEVQFLLKAIQKKGNRKHLRPETVKRLTSLKS